MSNATISSLPKDLALAMQSTGVWQEASPVALERLSLITISYIDFAGQEQTNGEIIVLDAIAEQTAKVFLALFKLGFPINKIRSLHHYSGDDNLSMADNNTSGYCYRPIEGSTLTSLHSYGLAIDINPLQNPFVMFDETQGTASIHPPQGWEYLNRHNKKSGMVETIVPLLAEHGFFIWGGNWTTPIDYHHFQPQRGIAELLCLLTKEDGELFIKSAIEQRNKLTKLDSMPHGQDLQPLIELYKKSKSDFFENWVKLLT